jgi:parvulin-like peptidyl-prolyl isomerase
LLKVPLPRQSILLIIVVDSSTQADKVLQRLKNGEDFAALAKELSIDPTASDGGSMGRVNPAALRAELRDQASEYWGNQPRHSHSLGLYRRR